MTSSSSHLAQVVHLPQVEAIGPEPPQRIVEQAQRPVARALVRLRREEDAVARLRAGRAERLAVVVLALLVGGRRVAVADAQAQRLEDHGHRFLRAPGRAQDALAAQRHGQDARAGPSQRPLDGGGGDGWVIGALHSIIARDARARSRAVGGGWSLAAGPAFANGTIEGTIRLAGPAPAVAARPILKDASVCGREAPAESVVVGKAGALANVVVSVTDARIAGTPPPSAGASVDQRQCRYVPHVQAVTVGTPLAVMNNDAILHNVHGNEARRADRR